MKDELFSFDDVLLKPQYSNVMSRKDVDLSTSLNPWLKLDIPIIAANMDTVCEQEMATAISKLGGMGVLHRNLAMGDRMQSARILNINSCLAGVAVGVNELDKQHIETLIQCGVNAIVVDVAHGDALHVYNAIIEIKCFLERNADHVCLIGGNIATGEAVERMVSAGADCVKVGIGPGAACLTRINTGVGVPQLSAIMECAARADYLGVSCIADGGMKTPGDVAKAIAAGADAVMLGGMLAGTDEAPGDIYTDGDGKRVKGYRGMASSGAGSSYVEGAEGHVAYKGPVADVITSIKHGLRSSMSYSGAFNISEFHAKSEFVRVSPASLSENGAHGTVL
jgi:IMP dehydrogenase|tara:strand:- start:1809 stop:2822 length:1014 start_codon:yes stop_codon:yes gene_type:complete